jgi:hypothetical protein
MDMKRLRDLMITVLGLWLMISPRVLQFAPAHTNVVWNTWIIGAAIILLMAVSRYLEDVRNPWEDLACSAFGFWLIIAPWALGFTAYPTERANSVIVGTLVVFLALWAMAVDGDLRRWMDNRMHHHHPSQ